MRIGRVELKDGYRWVVLAGRHMRLINARTFPELVDWVRSESRITTETSVTVASKLLSPVAPTKVIGVGLNYKDHAAEVGITPPDHPLLFAKPTTSVIGHEAPILVDSGVTNFADWEVELAVIVGDRMRRIPVERALDYVLGYTVANDVTARDIQASDGQWFRAKSLDTFCPLGPWLVTADEIGDPQALELVTRVNGEILQRSATSQMCFSVAELLAFCSRHFVLEPGDVLLTGTPPGVGVSMTPPRSLQGGDVVEVEIDRIGALANPVEEIGDDRTRSSCWKQLRAELPGGQEHGASE